MAVHTTREAWTAPAAQTDARMRAVTDLWRKIRELNDSDADRTKIAVAYYQLGDVLELLPEHYRIVLGGSIEPEDQ